MTGRRAAERQLGGRRGFSDLILFLLIVFLVIDLGLGIVGFIAFMPGATGTNQAAFIALLLLNAPVAIGLAVDWLEKRKGPLA
jgi:hypothetical protein